MGFSQNLPFFPWDFMTFYDLSLPFLSFHDLLSSSGTFLSSSPSFHDLLWPSTALLRLFLDLPQGSVASHICNSLLSPLGLLEKSSLAFLHPHLIFYVLPAWWLVRTLLKRLRNAQNIAEPFSMCDNILYLLLQ